MEVRLVSTKEYISILEKEYNNILKDPRVKRILKDILKDTAIDITLEELTPFGDIPLVSEAIEKLIDEWKPLWENLVEVKTLKELKKKLAKSIHSKADLFLKKISHLGEEDFPVLRKIDKLHRIFTKISSIHRFNKMFSGELTERLSSSEIPKVLYFDDKRNIYVPELIFYKNTFKNLYKLLFVLKIYEETFNEKLASLLLQNFEKKNILSFDGLDRETQFDRYHFFLNKEEASKFSFLNHFAVPAFLSGIETEEELLKFLIENYVSPYVLSGPYDNAFEKAISLSNKEPFLRSIILEYYARHNPERIKELSYERLKELGIPDSSIVKMGFISDILTGNRAHVLAQIRSGRKKIVISAPNCFNDEKIVETLIDKNPKRIDIRPLIRKYSFSAAISDINSVKGKIAFLYIYSLKADYLNHWIPDSIARKFTNLAGEIKNLDKKYRLLLLQVILQSGVETAIVKPLFTDDKGKQAFFKLVDKISSIPDKINIDIVAEMFNYLSGNEKRKLLSKLSPQSLSKLLYKEQLSEEDKKIVYKFLNHQTVEQDTKLKYGQKLIL